MFLLFLLLEDQSKLLVYESKNVDDIDSYILNNKKENDIYSLEYVDEFGTEVIY